MNDLTAPAELAIRHQVRAFLARYLKNVEVDDDEDLFGSGLVNSLFAMQLVLFVESTYGMQVENEDLDIKNFRSVDAITALILNKRASTGA
jgi:methoxymalonate biosynthesis acyl carrier protein